MLLPVRLVTDLKDSGEPGFVDAVFMLYDLSGDAIDPLLAGIHETKALARRDGQQHSVATTFSESDAGISFVTQPNDCVLLRSETLRYAQLKKHQSKATQWLGLGCLADSPRLAEVAVYNHESWRSDDELDVQMRALNSGTVPRSRARLGRNELCFCGSGLKFKRCHGR